MIYDGLAITHASEEKPTQLARYNELAARLHGIVTRLLRSEARNSLHKKQFYHANGTFL